MGLTQKQGAQRRKEATVTIVTSARSMMMKMLREGIPIAEIARRIGVTRQTIYNWKKSIEERKPEPPTRKRKSKLDPFREYIGARLERFDLPASVLLREIREKGYTGGRSASPHNSGWQGRADRIASSYELGTVLNIRGSSREVPSGERWERREKCTGRQRGRGDLPAGRSNSGFC